jgi:hypothetical protein
VDCIYFEANESYQRGRVGEQFEEIYRQTLEELVHRSSQKAAMVLNLAGWVSYRHARKHPGTLDWEIRTGLEDVRQRLSPLAIPKKAGTPYGDVLMREIQEFLKTERLEQDAVAAGIDAAHRLIAAISGDTLKTNRYLKGLIHYMESRYPGLTQQLAEEEKARSGLILPNDRITDRQQQPDPPDRQEKRIIAGGI